MFLSEAVFDRTVFALTSLRTAKGFETCEHAGPSAIDYHTLMESGPLPEAFLRGCGLSEEFIRYLPSFWNDPIEFYSCFISYSHADKAFARRLRDALQGRGIRCWLDEHQLLPGDQIHRAVDEAVRLWDKVLLCCSEASLQSWWVDKEIQKALMKEEQLWKERVEREIRIKNTITSKTEATLHPGPLLGRSERESLSRSDQNDPTHVECCYSSPGWRHGFLRLPQSEVSPSRSIARRCASVISPASRKRLVTSKSA